MREWLTWKQVLQHVARELTVLAVTMAMKKQKPKHSVVVFQQESQPSEEDIGGQLSHLEQSETPDGRTSMRSVTRQSGDRRLKNSIYLLKKCSHGYRLE
jgi:hypothetical protein